MQHYLHLLIDHNRCIHQQRFKSALWAVLKLFNRLDETVAKDVDSVSALVLRCFAKVTGLAGLSDTQFYQLWNADSKKNANEISYYFNLILVSRSLEGSVIHDRVSCVGCKERGKSVSPIKGVRFKCTRCSNVNLCTLCYLSDYQTARHNPNTHKLTKIYEPTESGTEDRLRAGNLLSKLLKVFYFAKAKRSESEEVTIRNDEQDVKTIRFLDETPRNVSPVKESKDKLLTVIEKLSKENR